VLFLTAAGPLVRVFTPEAAGLDYVGVTPLATTMLRLAALYTLSDAIAMVFGGALRGAGDTQWCMRVSVVLHWLMAGTTLTMAKVMNVRPTGVWFAFVLAITLMGAIYYGRFRVGAWKSLRVLDEEEPGAKVDGRS
jgi:MATE family multidrug resistance protein